VGRQLPETAGQFSLEASLGFLIYRVHQRALALLRRQLEPTGLTPQQFGVLALLHANNDQRQAELCARGATDPNTMVGLVDRLEAMKLVRRRRDPADRRAHLVCLTAAGRRAFYRCLPRYRRAAKRCWMALSGSERQHLRRLLLKVLAAPLEAAMLSS